MITFKDVRTLGWGRRGDGGRMGGGGGEEEDDEKGNNCHMREPTWEL